MVPMEDVPPIRETDCHVEISAVERYPDGLKHLLDVTKSISVMDDTHVFSLRASFTILIILALSDLSNDLDELEECMLRRYESNPSSYQLPGLRRMHLQELPLLKHLHVDDAIITAPAWKELHVRGCWSLRRLPRLNQQPDKMEGVKVSGERAWWQNLRWDREEDDGASLHGGRYHLPAGASPGVRLLPRARRHQELPQVNEHTPST
ncbi:hypothetical protein EJB05_38166, partial [Eragrostis curvula]